ncbi:hypothetical protein ILYODFUR_008830 [Ilyodon furcidens]|uniref:Uncharacterized protein n=1 Tax=Ilyodon furcidens TaxID=33524 RepID=A0ABV0SXX8_9TELE
MKTAASCRFGKGKVLVRQDGDRNRLVNPGPLLNQLLLHILFCFVSCGSAVLHIHRICSQDEILPAPLLSLSDQNHPLSLHIALNDNCRNSSSSKSNLAVLIV